MHNSNSDFESQVTTAIQRAAHLAGRKLRCETREGIVTLHGTVESYFQKQMAQEAVRRIDGVQKITNLLQVQVSGVAKLARGRRNQRDVTRPFTAMALEPRINTNKHE